MSNLQKDKKRARQDTPSNQSNASGDRHQGQARTGSSPAVEGARVKEPWEESPIVQPARTPSGLTPEPFHEFSPIPANNIPGNSWLKHLAALPSCRSSNSRKRWPQGEALLLVERRLQGEEVYQIKYEQVERSEDGWKRCIVKDCFFEHPDDIIFEAHIQLGYEKHMCPITKHGKYVGPGGPGPRPATAVSSRPGTPQPRAPRPATPRQGLPTGSRAGTPQPVSSTPSKCGTPGPIFQVEAAQVLARGARFTGQPYNNRLGIGDIVPEQTMSGTRTIRWRDVPRNPENGWFQCWRAQCLWEYFDKAMFEAHILGRPTVPNTDARPVPRCPMR